MNRLCITGANAILAIALSLLFTFSPPTAAKVQEGYKQPPKEIADIVLRAPSPGVSLSPDRRTMLMTLRESLPPVADMAKPMVRLAGLRLDTATNDRHGPRAVVGLTIRDLASGASRPVSLPENADIAQLSWSADSRYVSFTMTGERSVGLWVLDIKTAKAKPVIGSGVNPIFSAARWLSDGRLLVFTIPENRGPQPVRSLTPTGPAISNATGGETAQTRTYQDLLKDPHDEALLSWLVKSQPVIIDVKGRKKREIGAADFYISASSSPDGQYLLVRKIKQPFSYQVPWGRFAQTSEVWTAKGKLVATIAEQPLADNLPVGGVVTGPRSVGWHPTESNLLLWVEALDGGNPKKKVKSRDKLMGLAAPFSGSAREIFRMEDRYNGRGGLQGSNDLIITDYDRDTGEIRRQLISLEGKRSPKLLELRNRRDEYANPGEPLAVRTSAGKSVARVEQGRLFLKGEGASPEGNRPFLRSLDLATLKTTEIWRNSGESYERVVDLVGDEGAFITYYEDPVTPGNYRLHKGGKIEKLTDFADPHPELTGIQREMITYKRKDGVQLSATLYLPAGYKKGDKLPVLVWAYPREYKDAATAGQVRTSKYRFTRFRGASHLFLLTQGYAVMDRTAMPIVGSNPETVNDTFIEQVVASAEAAVEETVRRGFGDGKRVGVGGHSYGAFMTAHLLANSDLFRAGIARSGAYNRTLTPFGFQAERRTFWEAPETYYRLSPFTAANRINEPMLLIHGAKDNNSGTYPQQSERMFAAVKGTGGTARLVMLPHESHGYRGRESVLHTLAEMAEWFDRYVKPAVADDK